MAILKKLNLRPASAFLQETKYMLLTYLAIFYVQNSWRPHEIGTNPQHLVAQGTKNSNNSAVGKLWWWLWAGGGVFGWGIIDFHLWKWVQLMQCYDA